jgi:excisionase family DNA binding protein
MTPRTQAMTHVALSISDVVAAIGIGRTKVYAAIKAGELPTVKIGKRTLVLAEDLRVWLRTHRIVGEAA